MEKTLEKLRSEEPVVIAAVGDSRYVTTMWTFGRKNWFEYLAEALWEAYGDGFITMINACKCGLSYADQLERMESSLLRFRPDLVITGIAMQRDPDNPDAFAVDQDRAREFVRRLRDECGSEVLFMTHTPIVYRFGFAYPEDAEPGLAYENSAGSSAAAARAEIELAEELGCACVDVYGKWQRHRKPFRRLQCHPQHLCMRMHDIIHPGPVGHLAIFRDLTEIFDVPRYFPWEEVYPADE